MEEFNKKTDREILKIKNRYITNLIFITLSFFPIITTLAISAIINCSDLNIIGLCKNILVLIPLIIIYVFFYKRYSTYLIYGRNVEIENLYNKKEEDVSCKIINENIEGYVLKRESFILTEAEVLDKILKVDPHFSKTHFYSYVKSLFILIQEAWSNNDYSKLRSFEDDRLFHSHKEEIMDLIKVDKKDIRDNINIKGVILKDFKIENNKEILIVAITVSMRRIFNNQETKYNYPYMMAFSRNVGVKTNTNIKLSASNCSNCGAVIDVTEDGICNYCNTSLISGEHEWVLVDFKLVHKI